MAAITKSVYVINVCDIIESVDSNWLDFARDNDAPDLTENTVIGKPLFDFLDGRETKRVYRIVHDRVRRTRQSVRIPFRCDGPSIRRYMELRITPLEQGMIEFVGETIREEERAEVPLFDSKTVRAGDSIVVCVWCKQVQVERDVWLEVEDAIERMSLFETLPLPPIAHGVCDECKKRVVE